MIGTQIGRYRIEHELGRGGMGVVYRGTQVTLDRAVAIKMLPAHLADSDNQERFRREALTLARLAHPNIVHIYDVEEQDGHSFIMMEHIGGGSLGDRIRAEAPVAAGRAVEIMSPVLSALHAAHLAGVVHRDIKPDNILFTSTGRPKLTDFGIAHLRDGGSRTRTGVMLGTPYYMSPEQAQGRPVTAAADLYAVGVVLYEMLAGRVPFSGDDPLSVALKHVQESPLPLGTLRPDLPAALCELVHRALLKAPEARFGSAAAMQDALESASGWSPGYTTLDPDRVSLPLAGAAAPPPSLPTAVPPGPPTGDVQHDVPARGTAGGTGDHGPRVARDGGPRGVGGAGVSEAIAASTATGAAALSRVGRDTIGWLAKPGWRGHPRAVWAGAAALILALAWGGAEAVGRTDRSSAGLPPRDSGFGVATPPDRPGDDGRSGDAPTGDDLGAEAPPPSFAGGGDRSSVSPIPRGGTGLLGGSSARPLTEAERAALQDLVRGGAAAEPESAVPRGEDSGRRPPDEGGRSGLATPEANTGAQPESPTPHALVRAIVDRQLRAVEEGNRSLFLQDFHPSIRAEAAADFDLAVAGTTSIRSTLSNLTIEFLEPDHAFVTFDVEVTFTVRADGRTLRDSYKEMWDVRREGERWWIVAWN